VPRDSAVTDGERSTEHYDLIMSKYEWTIRASGTSSQVRISATGKNRRIPMGAHVRDRKAVRVQEESIAESGSEYSPSPVRLITTNRKFSSEPFLELIVVYALVAILHTSIKDVDQKWLPERLRCTRFVRDK
jgi:hypothetical protein